MRNARTWIELSRSALQHNLSALRSIIGPQTLIAPVVKANAYGHGITEINKLLRSVNIWGVCVAYGQEALDLRQAGWNRRILVLSAWEKTDTTGLVRLKVELAAWNIASFNHLVKTAHRLRTPVSIHLKLDTGTSRIGFRPEEINQLQRKLKRRDRLVKIAGVFSHLANSEETFSHRTKKQINHFATLNDSLLANQGITHLACTAAALRYPDSRLDLIRYGIGLYGHWPSTAIRTWAKKNIPKFRLQPVLTWKSYITQVKLVPNGTAIGYGSTIVVKRPSRIGIVPVGYSDGYDRRASNRAWVMISNKRAPVIGRVSMNLCAVDVTNIPTARLGSVVTLIGSGISAEQFSKSLNTISYEVLARINTLIPRSIVP